MTNIIDLNAKRFEQNEREYLKVIGRSRLAVQLLAERLSPADFERFTNLIRDTGGHFFDAVFGEGSGMVIFGREIRMMMGRIDA
jgi:hypothetical protein